MSVVSFGVCFSHLDYFLPFFFWFVSLLNKSRFIWSSQSFSMQYIHVSDNNELVSENEQTPQNICLYIISVLLAYKRAEQMKKKKTQKEYHLTRHNKSSNFSCNFWIKCLNFMWNNYIELNCFNTQLFNLTNTFCFRLIVPFHNRIVRCVTFYIYIYIHWHHVNTMSKRILHGFTHSNVTWTQTMDEKITFTIVWIGFPSQVVNRF